MGEVKNIARDLIRPDYRNAELQSLIQLHHFEYYYSRALSHPVHFDVEVSLQAHVRSPDVPLKTSADYDPMMHHSLPVPCLYAQ